MKEIYADGIGKIHFVRNVVHFDFMSLQPEGDGQTPSVQSAVSVTMPSQGFLGAYNAMQQMIDRLVAAGLLTKNEAVQSTSETVQVIRETPQAKKKTGPRAKGKKK